MVARALGVKEADLDQVVKLGAQATKTTLREMNDDHHALEHYRVVHFATHGVVAGQWRDLAEPGLILTPPKDITQADKDDGYLSASDVTQLKLNADWVVLSACNTAAGENSNAETLSGLAKAFFYAGARALLVSHWPVKSNATVKLITAAVEELKKNDGLPPASKIGRAEAMRRSSSARERQRGSRTWRSKGSQLSGYEKSFAEIATDWRSGFELLQSAKKGGD